MVQINRDTAEALVDELENEFFIDLDQVLLAIERGRSFNVIHLQSTFKFDLFPLTSDAYQQAQFAKRRFEVSSLFGPEPMEFAVSSPEDVILSKL